MFPALVRCEITGCTTLVEPHLDRCRYHRHQHGARAPAPPRSSNRADRPATRERRMLQDVKPEERRQKPKRTRRVKFASTRRVETTGERDHRVRAGAGEGEW